jgi:hypothetical protein
MSGYTYDMKICLGQDRTYVMAAFGTLEQLTGKVKGHGCKPYMDNVLLVHDLFNDLTKKNIVCCRRVQANRKQCYRTLLAAFFCLFQA